MKKLLIIALLLFSAVIGFCAFGQTDSTAVATNGGVFYDAIDWLIGNWYGGIVLSAIAVHLLSRVIPTEKAQMVIDIIGWIFKAYEKFIPNRKKGGGVH